jgi:hypothetical protein
MWCFKSKAGSARFGFWDKYPVLAVLAFAKDVIASTELRCAGNRASLAKVLRVELRDRQHNAFSDTASIRSNITSREPE